MTQAPAPPQKVPDPLWSDLMARTEIAGLPLGAIQGPFTGDEEALIQRAARAIEEAQELILAQRKKIEQLEALVARDEMTGLLNRRGLEDQVRRELSRLRRGQSRGCALVLFDLDKFKAINDNHGHPAGDAAIRLVGNYFARTVRETDAVARLGGDEFALILTNLDMQQAQMRATVLAEGLNKLRLHWKGQRIQLRGTFGLARAKGEEGFDRLYQAADEALYLAKNRPKA